jgi:nanoRNase/pAp phosphatase (c-di-AMP/oligoRNAs hydrolase)
MPGSSRVDEKEIQPNAGLGDSARGKPGNMTAFVESCVETAVGSAVAVERRSRHRPRAHRLLRVLKDKKNVLITTHQFPDPDALASSYALSRLLKARLKEAQISIAIKGNIGGGYNAAFVRETDLKAVPFDEKTLGRYDAVILLDAQPLFKFSPLPASVTPTAVIDHHRARGRRPKCDFCDIRTDVGATSSIVFSYFMEMEVPISPDLAAVLLFAIETDLAGAAGQPGELDNMALSSLTLLADTRRLYRMRHADLPQSVYTAHAGGLANAVYYDSVMTSHLESVESPEMPAVIADFLLRFEPVQWVLVTAVRGSSLQLSLRTSSGKGSAADIMRRLLRHLGEGGGHRTKAGGAVPLETGSDTEIERIRTTLRQRLLRALKITGARGQRLVPRDPEKK